MEIWGLVLILLALPLVVLAFWIAARKPRQLSDIMQVVLIWVLAIGAAILAVIGNTWMHLH